MVEINISIAVLEKQQKRNSSLIVQAEQKSVLKAACSRGQQRVCAMLALISDLRFSE